MMAPFSVGKGLKHVKSLLVSKVVKRLARSIYFVFHKLVESFISLCVHRLVLTALRWLTAINFLRDCVEVHDYRINRKVFFVAVRLRVLKMLQIPRNVMNKQVQFIEMVHELNLFLNCMIFDGRIHHSFGKEENVKINLLSATEDKS